MKIDILHEYRDKYNHTPNLAEYTLRVETEQAPVVVYIRIKKRGFISIKVKERKHQALLTPELEEQLTRFCTEKVKEVRVRHLVRPMRIDVQKRFDSLPD